MTPPKTKKKRRSQSSNICRLFPAKTQNKNTNNNESVFLVPNDSKEDLKAKHTESLSSNTFDDSLSQPKKEIPQVDLNSEMLNLLKDIDAQEEEADKEGFRASYILKKSSRK